jgi:anti-sigma regulatory factor (Ser/Thr protein kinase)
MSGSFAFTMTGYLSSLQECIRALEDSSVYQEMPPSLRFVAELILDELASNTLKYGGLDCHEIVVQLDFDGESMRMTLIDDAMPFDPWKEAPTPQDLPGALEDLTIGGRGVHMLKQATDSQHYERKDGKNINRVTRSVRRPVSSVAA